MEAVGLARTAEFCHLLPPGDRPALHKPACAIEDVKELKAAAEREHDRRLLAKLSRLLGAAVACLPGKGPRILPPRHQIPRQPLRKNAARRHTGIIDRIATVVIARDEVDRHRAALGHRVGIHPVARDLKIWEFALDDRHIMLYIPAEALAAELRIVGVALLIGSWRRIAPRFFLPRRPGIGAVIHKRRPFVTVDPGAVYPVFACDLTQLRQQYLVHVR